MCCKSCGSQSGVLSEHLREVVCSLCFDMWTAAFDRSFRRSFRVSG